MKSLINTRVVLLVITTLIAHVACARQIDGVKVPEQIVQQETGQTLMLNGAGMRTKFFFDIYVGALYLTKKTSDPKHIISSDTAKRITMYFVYSKVSTERMRDGWNDAFADALNKASYKALKDKIDRFDSYFPDMVKGDRVVIDFIPSRGVVVSLNGQRKGVIAGDDFQRALLSIWLGDSPADEELKDGMLGIGGD